MILESKGVILRHAKIGDVKDYYKSYDKESRKNLSVGPKSINEARSKLKGFIKEYNFPMSKRSKEFFIIEVNNQVAGWISLNEIVYKHKAYTSSFVFLEYRNLGLGTLTHNILLKYAFKKYKLVRVYSKVRSFNKASANMLIASGYKLEGVLKKDHYDKGKYYDKYMYAKVR